ncbi:endoplasmic reticulum-based factor for assembly of V-ATPase-domain-containing protein [Aspergillus karnatakaensis]|uniref:TMEM199/VMA12 family protein n=1 Tax=Aspergillus karnatakaensis TaxID=1810916 RepID=UPI003CCD8C17
MVRLVTTSPILSALEAIPPSTRSELKLPDTDTLALGTPISHDDVIRISHYFRDKHDTNAQDSERKWTLDTLLRGTKLYIPPPPPKPEPSPEYLALKSRLLAATEADAYTRMVSPLPHPATTSPAALSVFNSSTPALSALHDPKAHIDSDPNYKDPLTPGLVLNIFLSVLITGFSVYWMLTSFRTSEVLVEGVAGVWRFGSPGDKPGVGGGASEPVRVLLSLFAALAVGVAEVAIYAIYLGKVEKARGRERRVKERKEVLGSEEVRGRESEKGDDAVERQVDGGQEKDGEVIWGRGPNGGLRRRVREKWEEKQDLVQNESENQDQEKDK